MLKNLKLFFYGYLIVEARGTRFIRLINSLAQQNYKIWNVKRKKGNLYFSIAYSDWHDIKKVCANSTYKLSIIDKKGIIFLLNKLCLRKFLVLGLLIMFFLLHLFSNLILSINIKGNNNLAGQELLASLKDLDVKPGSIKRRVDKEKIKQQLSEEYPIIVWVELSYQGTELLVEIIEKDEVESSIKAEEIVAAKEGIITEIIVLKGSAVVSEGEVVQKGDLLINNQITSQKDDEIESIKGEEARGLIKARTWHEGYGEANLERIHYQPTGEYSIDLILRKDDIEYLIKGDNTPPYPNFIVQEKIKNLSKWRNINLPIELITRRYKKVEVYKELKDLAVAKEIAINRAKKSILQELSKEAIILDSQFELLKNDDLVRVKLLIEAEEDIGRKEQ